MTSNEYTYAEARECSSLFGCGLVELGLSKGDVLAVMCMNSPEYVMCMLGAIEFGITVTPISISFKSPEIARQLEMSESKKVLTEKRFLPMLTEAVQQTKGSYTY